MKTPIQSVAKKKKYNMQKTKPFLNLSNKCVKVKQSDKLTFVLTPLSCCKVTV